MKLEKLIPVNVEWNGPNEYGVYSCNKTGVYRTQLSRLSGIIWEYYFTTDAYINECIEQHKSPVTANTFRKLGLTPGPDECPIDIIRELGLHISGYIDNHGKLRNSLSLGYVGSVSLEYKGVWVFEFSDEEGIADITFSSDDARPCLFISEEDIEETIDEVEEKAEIADDVFDEIVKRAEDNGAILGPRAGLQLGNILGMFEKKQVEQSKYLFFERFGEGEHQNTGYDTN